MKHEYEKGLSKKQNKSVFPIPSYSDARSMGLDSKSWVAQLPVEHRREHIPMPYVGGKDDECQYYTGGGELVKPVHADGQRYLNRVPSWIVVDEQVDHLSWDRIWKSFNLNI